MSKSDEEHIRPLAGLGGRKPPAPAWFEWALGQPSEEGAVSVRGAKIAWSAWGEVGRRGLVFIHGGRAHREWWRPFAPFFANQYRVVAFDLSGMGDSDWRPRYTMDGAVDELFAVVDAARLGQGGRPVVVGHSFGGWVTLAAVERRGERLSGAVIIDSPIAEPDPDEGYTINRPKGEDESRKRPAKVYRTIEEPIERFRFLPNQPCDQLYLADYIARTGLVQAPHPEGGTGWAWKFDPSHGRNFEIHFERDLFLAARCPLAFIYGEESLFSRGPGFDHLRAQTRGRSPFITIPTAHHHLMMEQPIAFIAALRALLNCWPVRVGA
ncbi:alpha/beta fold hydrolase [Amphiplicatus metriothermophilus]|uniref:Pimeloyl-ACP methyl ester carboxylesterase n=1 Tax=Amphiplicatus metriothermophilus TaxID=1519374 RepID=A0A239PPJ9_9PROT|nr:alpha/beta hydrolase [Amphiplicatus metriothermophilus]MBB5518647.1 pimeloyl-ACP methyl ester carboxylesterase [Amphiplicatus metriothermophilus]SNT72195.1 Pimeloyl-ACP methyl ester carboxylesterase [Amphiplicatus metriothermophilus]